MGWSTTLVALLAFAVYVLTAAPAPYLLDSAELAAASFGLGVAHPPGEPVALLWGKLFTLLPLGSVAFKVVAVAGGRGRAGGRAGPPRRPGAGGGAGRRRRPGALGAAAAGGHRRAGVRAGAGRGVQRQPARGLRAGGGAGRRGAAGRRPGWPGRCAPGAAGGPAGGAGPGQPPAGGGAGGGGGGAGHVAAVAPGQRAAAAAAGGRRGGGHGGRPAGAGLPARAIAGAVRPGRARGHDRLGRRPQRRRAVVDPVGAHVRGQEH